VDEQESVSPVAEDEAPPADSLESANSAFLSEFAALISDEPPAASPASQPAAAEAVPAPAPDTSPQPATLASRELEELRQYHQQTEAAKQAAMQAQADQQQAAIMQALAEMPEDKQQIFLLGLQAEVAKEELRQTQEAARRNEADIQSKAKRGMIRLISERSGIDPDLLNIYDNPMQIEAFERTVLAERQHAEGQRRQSVQQERAATGADAFGRGAGGALVMAEEPKTVEEANQRLAAAWAARPRS
jgi:hypothetical protein